MIGPAEIEDMRLELEEAQARLKAAATFKAALAREGTAADLIAATTGKDRSICLDSAPAHSFDRGRPYPNDPVI